MYDFIGTHDESELCIVQNDYVDAWNTDRITLLGVIAWPTIAGGGVTDIWPTSCLEPTFAWRASLPSPMTIDISEQGEGQFTAHLYAEQDIANAQFFMVATLDESVPCYGGGTSHLPFHVKVYLTDPLTGDALSMSAGESLDISKSFAVDPGWNYDDMGVAAWVSVAGGSDASPCSYGPLGNPNEVLQSRWVGANADLTAAGETTPAIALSVAPNPFNPKTTVSYQLPAAAAVSLRVYDLAGRLVDVLAADAFRPAGEYSTSWDGHDLRGRELPSGVYLCRLTAGAHEETRRMVMIR